MLPIELLMTEHILIERMIKLMSTELTVIAETKKLDLDFVFVTTDFLRIYADRCHHGKEEGILFRELSHKNLPEKINEQMRELLAEHILARKAVTNLLEATGKYASGNVESINEASKLIKDLTELYPRHIEKEDKHFFYQSMEHFSPTEQQSMLQEFWEFDKRMIHDKYAKVVEDLEESAHQLKSQGRQ